MVGVDVMADNWRLGVLKSTALPAVLMLALMISLFMGVVMTRSRAALHASEEKYRVLIERARDSIVIIQDGRFVYATRKTARMLGVADGTLEIRIFTDFIWADDTDMVLERYRARISGGDVRDEYDFRVIGADGQPLWVLLSAALISWQGRPATMAIITDITGRKRNELELQERHELLGERLKISQEMHRLSLDELLRWALDVAEKMTGSSIAFYHFVEADQKTISLQMWSTNTLKNMCRAEGKGMHYSVEQAGIWAECLRSGEAVVINNYEKAPGRRGMPQGHAPVTRLISLPVVREGAIRCIIGVGNKAEDYTERDVAGLSEFSESIWNYVEHKRAVQELVDERTRLAAIIEGTNVGTWEWNVQTGEASFNERWANIVGYTLEEISPVSIKTWGSFAHPDDMKLSEELLTRHFAGELDYYEFESRMKHKDGRWVWVLDRGRVSSRTAEGKPLLMQGTHQDITGRKEIEDALRRKTEELDRYFSSSLDLLCIASTEGRFIRVNPQWEQMLGYSTADLEGTLFLDYVHPDDLEATLQAMSQLDAQIEVLNFENRYRSRDGSYRWIEWRSRPIGTTIYAVARDITDRKSMEAALRESEEKLSALFSSMAEMVVLHELVFDEAGRPVNYRITDCNEAFTRITGIARNAAVGRLATEVFQSEEAPYLEQYYHVAMSGEALNFEVRHRYHRYYGPQKSGTAYRGKKQGARTDRLRCLARSSFTPGQCGWLQP
jgi:PAS domain S-box-containing protein